MTVKSSRLRAVTALGENFKGYLSPHAWTLCVGAGASKGILPDWHTLANNVINTAFDTKISSEDFKTLVSRSGWTLDSWIQSAANKMMLSGGTSGDFKELLEAELYSLVRAQARGLGLEKYLTVVLSNPKAASREQVLKVCDFLESSFPDCSLFQIGRALIRCVSSGAHPKAILTFNADTLLETYLDLKLRSEHYKGPGPWSHPAYPFVQVTRPGVKVANKIPIIHCHGAISPKESDIKHKDSRDRLVFLEQEYLAMAASQASWGETQFLSHAQSSKIVFFGLSMADSNIRRWMNAVNLEHRRELEVFGSTVEVNPMHIWLKPSSSKVSDEIDLFAMYHLGVRPAFIPKWQDVESAIVNLASGT